MYWRFFACVCQNKIQFFNEMWLIDAIDDLFSYGSVVICKGCFSFKSLQGL